MLQAAEVAGGQAASAAGGVERVRVTCSLVEARAHLWNIAQALEDALARLDAKINQFGLKQRPPCLVLVVLPDSAAAQRKAVKAWGDVTRQVATQCVVSVSSWVDPMPNRHASENHEV